MISSTSPLGGAAVNEQEPTNTEAEQEDLVREIDSAGHWSEWETTTTPEGETGRRRRWVFNDPRHPNNQVEKDNAIPEAEHSANEAECDVRDNAAHSVSPLSQPDVDHSVMLQTEHSISPSEESKAEYSAETKTEYSASGEACDGASAQLYDLAEFRSRLSTQSSAIYDKKKWKRSREKPGFLIKRIRGYNPVEDKYGVSYLYVLSRKPDRTSGDYSVYPFAGFFNWEALGNAGLFVKERKNAKRQQQN